MALSEAIAMKSPMQERRRFPRHLGVLPVEVRVASQSYPMECETTDISLCGCYVKNMFTLPLGTAVHLRIRLNDAEFQIGGTVKTADPGLGNGIEFAEMSSPQRNELANHLQKLLIVNAAAVGIIR